ncbi:hypothetical protein NIES2119_16915 [[Phormidium ambiguum] IAM M-71]|uniref:Low-complexity protein n=1 Tax=[Phormidium ambiguum] IAM M-71 TaxID=454136 RepID=A0A1U7IHU5_9CYAN|nr:pentapeptide repeat-containing protein [Phormidium ambiguum]OKH36705.1 hypothetical protein NIES2119_16915 [Phormidium ambiguum IAM M-71]
MLQPNPLELAKQGHPKARESLINRQMQPKGITAKVALNFIAKRLISQFLVVIFLLVATLLIVTSAAKADALVTIESKSTFTFVDCKFSLGCDASQGRGSKTTQNLSSDINVKPGANLSGQNLQGVNLHNSDLRSSDFSGANLSGSDLSNADLSEVKLGRIKNSGNLDFTGFDWNKVKLSKEDAVKIAKTNLANQDLFDLIKSDSSNINFTGINWSKVNLSQQELITLINLKASPQVLADLVKANPGKISLSQDDLLALIKFNLNNGGVLQHPTLNSQSLIDLLSSQGKLINVDLSGINLQKADLSGADLSKANLKAAKMPNGTIYRP